MKDNAAKCIKTSCSFWFPEVGFTLRELIATLENQHLTVAKSAGINRCLTEIFLPYPWLMHYSLCHYRKVDKRHLQQIFPSHSLDVLEGYWCGTEETGSFIFLLFS